MDGEDLETGREREEWLIASVWPDGIPERDRAVLNALRPELRRQTFDRLEAVWRADRGEPLAPLATLAGMKRAGFFKLRGLWATHSVAGLVPNEIRKARRVAASEDDPLRHHAREMLLSEPRRRNVDIAKNIRGYAVVPEGASERGVLQRIERLVRDERRSMATDPGFLKVAYGTALVLDTVAISLVLDEPYPALAAVSMLIETASGAILGSALGRARIGASLPVQAVWDALSFVRAHRADLSAGDAGQSHLALAVTPDREPDALEERLRPFFGRVSTGKVGGVTFGGHAHQVIGSRVGRMVIQPRRTLDFDLETFLADREAEFHSIDVARAIWRREVDRHNGPRVAALREAGIVDGAGSSDGPLAAAMRAVVEALGF